ncbi:MAG: hypothetical protein K6G56_07610 [Clostridiales bacterium]|nr:hypothetical protein [Clostridiales bacterium]
MKKKLIVCLAAAVVLLLIAVLIPRVSFKRFAPDASVYHVNEDGVDHYARFDGKKLIIVSSMNGMQVVCRQDYKVKGQYWPRLFGNNFFSEPSWKAITKLPEGALPAKMKVTCEKSWYAVVRSAGHVEHIEQTSEEGQESVDLIYFYEDSIVFDRATWEKVEGLDPELAEFVSRELDPLFE